MNKLQTLRKAVTLIGAVFIAGVVRAVGMYSFIVPNNFAPGGVTGLSAMLEYIAGGKINAGVFLFALNIPLIVIAFVFINKEFAFKTTMALLLSSFLMQAFAWVKFPRFESASTGDSILAALAGGILGGFGIGVLLKVGGSSGGTDVIATLIQRKFSATNVAWFIFLLDSSVVLASIFVYPDAVKAVLLSFVEMFASSKVAETFLQGFKSAVKIEIITSQPEELAADIIKKINRGVTMCNVTGMYTHRDRALLICIVRKRQLSQFRAILKNYPDSFAYITSAREVMGIGFNN